MKLYIYDHCPYCVKAVMIFGLKNIPLEPTVLLNDDIDTPTAMVGKKMVPILEKDDGGYMPESLDIVRYIDRLDGQPLITNEGNKSNKTVTDWLNNAVPMINLLAIPRTPQLPLAEFATEGARLFYTRGKTEWLGDFQLLLDKSSEFLENINQVLIALESLIKKPGAVNGVLSEDDLHLFASLRVLSAVKGVSYPPAVEAYRQRLSEMSGVGLLDEIAI
ncbi:glutaredoxin 2 [Endozoicomonas sp.]|nr:glutaredoxin 2 [Endozoicomonas sp.]